MLTGSMTNWQYVPMMKIEEFLLILDPEYEHPFKKLKNTFKLSKDVENVEDMKDKDV